MRIVQVGSVAGSAEAIEAIVPGVVSIPFKQAGARRTLPLKVLASPLRLWHAVQVASHVRAARPDVVHIHWVPNGIVGPLVRTPWVLHARGSDVRGARAWVFKPILRAATAVLTSTPDLIPLVGGEHIPNPVAIREGGGGGEWEVGIASAPTPIKGTALAEEALNGLNARIWRTRTPIPKEDFIERLARSRVVVGQLKLGVLGNVELEAMSVARPVVAYVDARWYADVPPVMSARTPAEVRSAVRYLLSHPDEAEALGRAAQSWVRRHHDPIVIADRLQAIYRSVVG